MSWLALRIHCLERDSNSFTLTSAVSGATRAQGREKQEQDTFGGRGMFYWSRSFVWRGVYCLVNLTLRKITLVGKLKKVSSVHLRRS